jgi:hypothetical protein
MSQWRLQLVLLMLRAWSTCEGLRLDSSGGAETTWNILDQARIMSAAVKRTEKGQ